MKFASLCLRFSIPVSAVDHAPPVIESRDSIKTLTVCLFDLPVSMATVAPLLVGFSVQFLQTSTIVLHLRGPQVSVALLLECSEFKYQK